MPFFSPVNSFWNVFFKVYFLPCISADVDEAGLQQTSQLVLLKWNSLGFLIFLFYLCLYLEAGFVWVKACNLSLSTAFFFFFFFPTALIDFFFPPPFSVLCPCRSRSPSPLCFSQVRKFVSKDSAGLRVRSHPSLQSEQIGIVHVNGTITFIDEVIDFRPGRP